ncbi:MAG: glycosyltransferase family 4 protein [Lachnospiraceae bacterium]|nr:glycosyltransferase family 4 protein [Lachnospiraceae bacterium]
MEREWFKIRKGLYVIDGIFLVRRLTGIERYAYNIVKEMDALVKPGRFILLVPMNCEKEMELKNIKLVKYGHFKGYLWEQTDLAYFLLKHRAGCISFCNTVPVLAPRGIVFLHDISLKVNPGFFATTFRGCLSVLCWCLMYRAIMMSGVRIATVSEFSKSEMVQYYKTDKKRISVIHCAWQHMEDIEADIGILQKYGLERGKFYFGMATAAPNKNTKWIIEAARQHGDSIFVLAGHMSDGVCPENRPENLILAGYVSDNEAKALMGSCKAFILPSFYEGFGLPPMEAFASGAEGIILSDIPCLREIYGDVASYIDPHDYDNTCLNVKEQTPGDVQRFLDQYSWKISAKALLRLL